MNKDKKTAPTRQFDIFWEKRENANKWNSVPMTEWDETDGRWAILIGHMGLENWIGSPYSNNIPGWNDADL